MTLQPTAPSLRRSPENEQNFNRLEAQLTPRVS